MCNPKRIKLALLITLLVSLFSTSAFAFKFPFADLFFKDKPVKSKVVKRPNIPKKQPLHVKVGVYVLNVGKYDLQSATYKMDFYLVFRCNAVCNDINFEIMNATSSNIRSVAKQKDWQVYRIQADLNKANNLRNYPFDSHTLNVIIENRKITNNELVFEVDPATTALDSNLNVTGFQLSPNWKAEVFNHYYCIFQQTFSSYKFTISITRPWLAGLLKGILPALIIVLCNFLALFMRIDHVSQRLGIATSTLIAAEVFHLNLTSSIPPLGYITYADMFMFINYLYLFVILIEVAVTMYFIDTKHHATADRVNRICAWTLPVLWIVFQATNWYLYNPTGITNTPS